MAGRSNRSNSNRRSGNKQRYEDLSRQNREGHRQVERSLKEAERIANTTRRSRALHEQ
jgi:hypothetical protein